MIKGLVFDFDGTILDTETPEYEGWKQMFADHGAELSEDAWCKVVGTNWDVFNPFDHLESQIGRPVDRERLFEEQRQLLREVVEKEVSLPGVEAMLEAAQEMGLKLAVASSSRREWVESHLRRLNLLRFFPVVKTADDVEKVKPDPALYREAVAALDIRPEEAVAVEDSVNGVKAAKAAGLFCVAVPNPITSRLDFSHADGILKTLHGYDLSELLDFCKPAN